MKLWSILFLLFLVSCGGPSTAKNEGSGSEIVGVVQTSDEKTTTTALRGVIPLPDAHLYLLKVDHKGTGLEKPTEYSKNDGTFRIADAPQGEWILEAFDPKTEKSTIKRVRVKGDGEPIDVGAMLVVTPATINCSINLGVSVNVTYEMYVLGTRTFAKGNQNKLKIALENIPAGQTYTVQFKLLTPVPATLEQKVTIPLGGTVDISFDLSKYL